MNTPSLRVLDEGPHHVVVDKIPDTVVVPGRGTPRPALLDLVIEQFGKGIRPVHRLDRGTSGCCLFAKTPFGERALTAAFRRRLIGKRYLAVLQGEPSFAKKTVDARLKRIDNPDAKRGQLAWQTVDPQGEAAQTTFTVLGCQEGRALVLASPQSGRMHQIRIHASHLGFPVYDDVLYGAEYPGHGHTIGLHAYALIFEAPKGGKRVVIAKEPPRFRKAFPGVSTLLESIETALKSERAAAAEREQKRSRPSAPSHGHTNHPNGGSSKGGSSKGKAFGNRPTSRRQHNS